MTAPRQTASSERNASERQSVEETGSPQTLSNQSQEETKSDWPFDPPLVPGELGKFAGYRIIKLLGQGGMGAVFLAEELILQRSVAIKMMKPDVAAKPDARERFLREARSAAGLKSDHIITIFQVGEVRDVPFLAMELLDGLAMDQWLNTQPKQLPIAEVTRIAQDVLSGLAAAQAKGLVHRDIKPANLWIDTTTGRVKILDFGLTRPSEGEHITQSGAIVGTPAYMAPEQADGQPVDGRADLFSLGVVLYRMLTGVNPFQRDGMMSTLSALATYHPPAISKSRPDAPAPLVKFVHRLLAKDANERPANAAQALVELSTINSQLLLKSVAITKPEVSPFADLDDDLPTTTLAPERQPKPTASAGKVKALPWLWVILGFFGLLCCGAAGVIIIKITNKDGSVTKIEVPEGSKLEVNGKNVTPDRVPVGPAAALPVPEADADRKAAEWVLSIGGSVRVNGEGRDIRTASELTKERFMLTKVNLNTTRVTDAGMANFKDCKELTHLDLGNTKVTDAGLAIFKDSKGLRHLKLTGTKVTAKGLEVFRAAVPGCKIDHDGGVIEPKITVKAPFPPLDEAWVQRVKTLSGEELLAEFKKEMDRRNPGFAENGKVSIGFSSYWPDKQELSLDYEKLKDLTPVQIIPNLGILRLFIPPKGSFSPRDGFSCELEDLSPLKGLSLRQLAMDQTRVADLGPLRGMPLQRFSAIACPIKDLEPLRDSPIWEVGINRTQVTDLEPLKDAPLKDVYASNTRIESLEPLRSKKIRSLYIEGIPAKDMSVIRDMPLERVFVSSAVARDNFKLFKEHPTLKTINSKPAAEFWRKVEEQKKEKPAAFKNSIGMEFVKVPKGTGWLGGGGGKQGETKVVIEQYFYLGKYEVTQEEWEAVTGQNPSHFSRSGAGKDAVKDIPDADLKRFPVENVSWDDCQLFIERLNKKEKEFGRVYRLPSEEEWEYASRGAALSDRLDSAFDFYFAKPTNQLLPDQANFSPDGDGKVGLKQTCKVGTYQPNQLGLYDMHGNVWEWCSNVYTAEGVTRACRGGGWNYGAGDCRSANRRSLAPSDRINALGFRLVLVPVGPAVAVPTAAADADRKAIEWLLNRGADFGYSNATGFHLVTKGMKHELPAGEVMLNSFNMSKREFSDQDLERFRGLKNLSTVVLVATEMTNVGCEHLATLPTLQKLYLTDTKISDDGIKHLAQAVKLDVLHISGTKITDIGLQHLAGLKALNELTVVKTGVSEAGVKKFAAALPKCKIESDFGVIEPK
jgi:serine/threonine protein kinase/formylglycine-generating enzyme required for sulfatase activity